MSDSGEDTKSDDQTEKEDGLCRDFVRGTCERKFCKYKHEPQESALNFCFDFQNSYCSRSQCKFIHCTTDEQEEYKKTGEMSNQILAEATRKWQLPGMQPICIQFRQGRCRRKNCKFRHISKKQEHLEIMELIKNNNRKHQQFPARLDGIPWIDPLPEDYENPRKRRLIDGGTNEDQEVFQGYCAGTPPAPILNSADAKTMMLEEEIGLLHKEINKLKKQVQDLTATNEFLLDQNAALRVTNKPAGGSMANPAPATPQQVIRTVANVPVSLATVPVSLATVPVSLTDATTCNAVSISAVPSVSIASPAQLLAPSQQIFVTTNPSSQLAIANSSQAQLAIAATNAQQLTVANVPQQLTITGQTTQQLALASQGQQQLALASQNQQQLALASQNQQQLALANQNQQQILAAAAASQQIEIHRTIQTSQPLGISTGAQGIVSYPIVTHSINHAMH